MKTREELLAEVDRATVAWNLAAEALEEFDALPENNQYDDYDEACAEVEEQLQKQAFEDCQGAYNIGAEKYTQEFIVNGVSYIGVLTCEYNRHDKTYYYVDESKFTVEPKKLP